MVDGVREFFPAAGIVEFTKGLMNDIPNAAGTERERVDAASRGAGGPGDKEMFDKFKDECGVFGIFGHPEAANLTYLGLYALQHRGQESAGIATGDSIKMRVSRAMGHVADA